MTSSADSLRSPFGLSEMNANPVLLALPPTKPPMVATAGSAATMSETCWCFFTIASKEIS